MKKCVDKWRGEEGGGRMREVDSEVVKVGQYNDVGEEEKEERVEQSAQPADSRQYLLHCYGDMTTSRCDGSQGDYLTEQYCIFIS